MIVSLIAAMSTNRVIGKGDKMPCHLPDDLQYFLDNTATILCSSDARLTWPTKR